jgi:hypothetical protein
MTLELAWIFVIFLFPCKAEGQFGQDTQVSQN